MTIKKVSFQRDTFRELSKQMNFCLPAFVLSFDPKNQRAQVQPAINRVDLSGWNEPLPSIIDVPVRFAGGGEFHIEHQVDNGDEGLLFFSQRCVDIWKQTGGLVTNVDGRMFNISDAFFGIGYRSTPGAISGFSNNGIKLRNKSGNHYCWLKNDGSTEISNGAGKIILGADGVVNINGVTFQTNGDVESPTRIDAKTIRGSEDVVFGNISGIDHRHTGVTSGPDTSGGPV